MGVNVGTAWVTLAASGKGISASVQKEMKGAGTKAGSAFGKEFNTGATKSVESTSTSLSSFGTKAIVGAAAIGAAFFGLASAAGDLSAAVSANEQVLGSASQAVQDFAETGVESVGLSETAILNAATSFGQLGKVIGLTGTDLSGFSTDLVTLAADMAAFKNVTPTQALEDLQSAFAGQPEVLRKYGIFLDDATLKQAYFRETGIQVSGTLTAQQRLIATNGEIWRQTGDIQGQAAREAGSLERKMADLKATVGNVAADFGAPLVGFATGLISAVGGGVSKLGEWNEATGGMLATGVAAGAGVAAVGAAAFGVVSKIKGAVDAFGKLSKGAKLATGIFGGVALAVTAGFIAYGLLTKNSREVAARTAEVAGALDVATEKAWGYAEATAGASGEIDGFAVAEAAMSEALVSTGEDGEKLTTALGSLGVQTEDVLGIFLAMGQDPVQTLTDLAAASGAVGGNAEILGQYVDEIERLGTGPAFSNLIDREFMGDPELAEAWITRNGEVIASMREVQDQADNQDLDAVASQYLNQAVAADADAEALIAQAEAQSGASRNGDDALEVYFALNDILAELPPAEREVAQEALGIADAGGEAASAVEEVTSVAADAVDTSSDLADAYNDAAGAADAFTSALDNLVNPTLDAQAAQDDLIQGTIELGERIKAAQDGEDGYSLALSGSTQEALDNREAIRGRVTDILSSVDAMAAEGASVEDVTAHYDEQRQALINQLTQFGLTEEAAAAYVDQLGLTPEAVDTAVTLSNEEQAKADIDAHLAELGEIPEDVATLVQALIDAGDYRAAEAALAALEKDRYVNLYIQEHGARGGAGRTAQQALGYGGYVPGGDPHLAWVGDASWDEAMLTVGNMENLRKQLQDDRIAGPIIAALPQVDSPNGSSARRTRSGDTNLISYEQNPTPAGVATALRMANVS